MRYLTMIALVTEILGCLPAQAELINFQEAIEAADLSVSVRSSGRGYVRVKSCSTCKPMRLDITPASVISVDGSLIPAGKELSRVLSGGVVIYDVATKQVVKLKL